VGLFYFDVEAEGEDPQQDRLVTVQFQPLGDDLRPVGALTVLTEWEWGEKEMVRSVLQKGVLEPTWDFVPVGNRLRFDLTFLIERGQRHGLKSWGPAELRRFWFEKPMLDLGSVLVLMNAGRFEGSSIGNFMEKRPSAEVPILYRQGKYPELLAYVEQEKDGTLALLAELRSMLTAFGERKRKP
jgi:hypothetical protein